MLEDLTICTYHNFSIGNLKQLKVKLKKRIPQDTIAINIICDIIKDIQHAKKLGQRMENRLKKYRKAVELLGFERKYKDDRIKNRKNV